MEKLSGKTVIYHFVPLLAHPHAIHLYLVEISVNLRIIFEYLNVSFAFMEIVELASERIHWNHPKTANT